MYFHSISTAIESRTASTCDVKQGPIPVCVCVCVCVCVRVRVGVDGEQRFHQLRLTTSCLNLPGSLVLLLGANHRLQFVAEITELALELALVVSLFFCD